MVEGFAKLLFAELIGEGLRSLLNLPVPGPVIGMFLVAIAIIARRHLVGSAAASGDGSTTQAADALIAHMGLLFVPAGVGILAVAPRLHGAWFAIGVALFASTLITLVVTGLVMHTLTPRTDPTVPIGTRGLGRHG